MSKVEEFLEVKGAEYQMVPHLRAYTALDSAAAERIPARMEAKVVMLRIDGKPVMAVLPATRRVDFRLLRETLDTHQAYLMSEPEFERLFPDCQVGAMPPFGNLYGMGVFMDRSLEENEEIVFNAGTHDEAIRMQLRDFIRLVRPDVFCFTAGLS